MKAVTFLLLAGCAFGDDTVEKTIEALNRWPLADSIYTADATTDLDQLPEVNTPAFRVFRMESSRPVVTISKEPWGEAQIGMAGFNPPTAV